MARAGGGKCVAALRAVAHPLENPATYQEIREEARELVARLETELSPGTCAQVLDEVRGQELDVFVEEILSKNL